MKFRKVPVRFGPEHHTFVLKPDYVPGSEYDMCVYTIASALFTWMQEPLFGA